MRAADALTIAAIGFFCGLIGREVLYSWTDIFRRFVTEMRLLATPHSAPIAPVVEPVASPISDSDFKVAHAWAQLNPWYAADPVLNREAQMIHTRLRQTCPDLSLEGNLAAVTVEMHARHPEIVPTRQ